MSEIEGLPEAWQRLLRDAQIPSQQRLAAEAEVSSATVNRIIRTGKTTPATVEALARVLTGGDPNPIWEAAGHSKRSHGPFPVESIKGDLELLTPKQRDALVELVRSMAHPDEKAGGSGGRGDDPDQKSDSGNVRPFPKRAKMQEGGATEVRSARDREGGEDERV